jgi:hypothetical protein
VRWEYIFWRVAPNVSIQLTARQSPSKPGLPPVYVNLKLSVNFIIFFISGKFSRYCKLCRRFWLGGARPSAANRTNAFGAPRPMPFFAGSPLMGHALISERVRTSTAGFAPLGQEAPRQLTSCCSNAQIYGPRSKLQSNGPFRSRPAGTLSTTHLPNFILCGLRCRQRQ